MKKIFVLLLLCLFVSPSFATDNNTSKKESNIYLRIGLTKPKVTYIYNNAIKDFDKFRALGINVSFGTNITDNFDADIGVKTFTDIIHNDTQKDNITNIETITKKTLSNTLLLTSGYFNIKTSDDDFKPYINLGLGIASISSRTKISASNTTEIKTNKNSNISFAYSVGIGFNTPISDNTLFDMNIKHYNLGKLRAEDILIEANSMSMGLKIKF